MPQLSYTLRLGALTLAAVFAIASPAAAGELLSTTVSSDDAGKWRRCHDGLAPAGAAAVTTRQVSAPAGGLVWADLTGSDAADWDVAIFDRADGRLVAGSAGPRSSELAEGFTVGRDLVVQACLVDGAASSAKLAVGYLDTRTTSSTPIQLVRVSTPTAQDKTRLANTGVDLTEHGGSGFVEAVLYGARDQALLRAANFSWTIRIADLAALERRNIQANRSFARSSAATAFPSGRDDYRRLPDYEADMKELAFRYPNLVKLITLPHESLEGRDILGVEITENVNVDDGKPVFMQLGVHHAREWPSSEHAMEWAFEVVNGYNDGDTRMRPLAQAVRTIVVPVVNVDGFNLSRESAADLRALGEVHPLGATAAILADPQFAYKRRNCRVEDGRRPANGECADWANSRNLGVDPNRNYGGLWGGPGASIDTGSDIYRGAGPFSEPETQNIRELVSANQVTTMITNHTFSNLVLRPPGVRAQGPPPDEAIYKDLGDRMAAQNGYTSQKGYELYDTTGTTEDWSYSATGGLGFTFEIGGTEFHPPFEQVLAEWSGKAGFEGKGNRAAYYLAMENAADEGVHSVIDGTATPGATIRLHKSFLTSSHDPLFLNDSGSSTGDAILLEDVLDTTMRVPGSGSFEFHTNPSTRPQNDDRTWVKLAAEPSRVEAFENSQPTVPGGGAQDQPIYYREFPFTLGPDDATAGLEASIDGGDADDYDIYLFRVLEGGARQAMGSSASATADEKIILENVAPGDFVLRVVNWLAPTPDYTGRFATFVAGAVEQRGRTPESWTLTCERPDGTVADTEKVTVDRGERVTLDGLCS